jgi:hypothetical protein
MPTSASRRKSASSKPKAQGQTTIAFHGTASRNIATGGKHEAELNEKIEKAEIKLEDEPKIKLEEEPEIISKDEPEIKLKDEPEIKLKDEPEVGQFTPEVEEPKVNPKPKVTDDKTLFPEGLSTLDLDADELKLWKAAVEKAKKISHAQLARNFKEKEKDRKTPRVHQKKFTMEQKILADWDVDARFGVSFPVPFSRLLFETIISVE